MRRHAGRWRAMRNPYGPERKECRSCVRIQPSSHFRPKTAVCHGCDLARQKKWRDQHPGFSVEGNRKHRKANAQRLYLEHLARIRREPEKTKARKAVRRALESGRLVRQACGRCGNHKAEAHHPDYSKPLEIEWLCRKCHAAEHRRAA